MKAELKVHGCLVEVRDNHSLDSKTRVEAGEILYEWRHHSEHEGLINRIHEFLSINSMYYVQIYMGKLRQRDLDGDHLWIRDHTNCLTVSQGPVGPVIGNAEGEWTDNEKKMALYLYQFTDASKR